MNAVNNNIVNTSYISFGLISKPLVIVIALAAIAIVGALLVKLGFLPCLFKGTANSNPDLTHSPSLDDDTAISSDDVDDVEPEPSSLQLPEGWDQIPEHVDKKALYETLSSLGPVFYQLDNNGICVYTFPMNTMSEAIYYYDFNDTSNPLKQLERLSPLDKNLPPLRWQTIPQWGQSSARSMCSYEACVAELRKWKRL